MRLDFLCLPYNWLRQGGNHRGEPIEARIGALHLLVRGFLRLIESRDSRRVLCDQLLCFKV